MRTWFLTILFLQSLLCAQVDTKFIDPNNCKSCHEEQTQDWDNTWHSRSHEEKNSLYKEVITYVQKMSHKTHADVAIGCAKCHNPRLKAPKIDPSYMYAKAFGLESEATKKVDEAFSADDVLNGISCYVCHNIETIHPKKNQKDAGFDIMTWTKGDVVVGPYPSNNRAVYHESEQRDFFLDSDKLCLACHEGNANIHNVPGYETGTEILLSKLDVKCVECHMSTTKKSIIAPHIASKDEVAIVRNLRDHTFAGGRNSDILETSLSVYVQHSSSRVEIGIQNLTPHSVPTGFSGRSLVVEVRFFDSANKLIDSPVYTHLRSLYLDNMGNEALSYVATKLEEDTRLAPLEARTIYISRPQGAKHMKIDVLYYFLSPQLQSIIPIKDEIFTKSYPVHSSEVHF